MTDAPDLAALHAEPDVQKWLGGHVDALRCETSIRGWTLMMSDDVSWYYCVLDADRKFVGFCTIIREEESKGAYHLTIALSQNFRSHGYAQAAVIEAVNLARQLPKVKTLVALVEDANASSQKLFLKFDQIPTSAMSEKILPTRTVKEWTFKLL